ncbi:transposase [Nonomuraea sp. AD125B]|uniref:transposase n=1 Tax=Nonomuraea sp. AD125B TaxID=3242897 RepID=UPI0035288DF9
MAAGPSVTPAQWLAQQIETGDPDMLRSMVKTMAETLMSAEADSLCGATYGRRSDERTNSRNGYRRASGTPGPAPWLLLFDHDLPDQLGSSAE